MYEIAVIAVKIIRMFVDFDGFLDLMVIEAKVLHSTPHSSGILALYRRFL